MPPETSRQVKFYLNDPEYEILKAVAQQRRMSMPALAKSLAFERLRAEGLISDQATIAPSTTQSRLETLPKNEEAPVVTEGLVELRLKNDQLSTEVARLEKDLAFLFRELASLRKEINSLAHPIKDSKDVRTAKKG